MSAPALLLIVVLLVLALASQRLLRLKRTILFAWQRGALFHNGKIERILEPGSYWTGRSRSISVIDTRIQSLQVPGQEVLTTDGLTLKITLAGEYRIDDVSRYLLTSTAPTALLYTDAQQALRDAVASLSFDDLLTTRLAINARMLELLGPLASRLGFELTRIEVRDMMLPAELRRAYAQTITAQKEGLARLERARAETAALRSLANAARLMQDHPGLLQLRAVQAVESSTGNSLTLHLNAEPTSASPTTPAPA